jgi:23S rRNA (pseudouridine1915-N3)-methyltransferase
MHDKKRTNKFVRQFRVSAENAGFGESNLQPATLGRTAKGILVGRMKITVMNVGGRAGAKDGFEPLVSGYLERCSGFARCAVEFLRSEEALLNRVAKQRGRQAEVLVLLDSRGRQMTSEEFAAWLGARRDEGTQEILFAVGPASGWTDAARKQAGMTLSLGKITMAHGLARLVMAEQIYRAVTILTGHPYHLGH